MLFEQLRSVFSSVYYLVKYPDVAASGVDPWQHFIQHGLAEGRWPCEFPAFVLEQQLWWQQDSSAFMSLSELTKTQGVNGALAAMVLSRWYGCLGHWSQVESSLSIFFAVPEAWLFVPAQQPWLLAFSAVWQLDPVRAETLTKQTNWPEDNNKVLAKAMLLPAIRRPSGLNQIWQAAGLQTVKLLDVSSSPTNTILDRLRPTTPVIVTEPNQPLVTVIVPLYNAAGTIATALHSLMQQSWSALEILVVDDGSSDESATIVDLLAATDRRIRLFRQPNSGAYVARNLALRHAHGEFITTHDADDWSHPQKIELQVRALQEHSGYMASVSHWVRCSVDLEFQHWRVENGWIYRNVSSLMFRRCVHQQLGFWDRVSVNADTEFYYRIWQAYGLDSIVEVCSGIPLALGRADSRSLSQTSFTHLRTQFAGVRRAYHEAARIWQQNSSSLYLTAVPLRRPFAVPERICRGTPEQQWHNRCLLIAQSEWFDAAWYLATYPDVVASGLSAAAHYLQIGARENRDPGPHFVTSVYRIEADIADDTNPLLHHIAVKLDRQALWLPDS